MHHRRRLAVHAFDNAIALEPIGADADTATRAGTGHSDRWAGHTSADYWNMVGPFGGATAGQLLHAVLQHPALLGEPLSLTINYAGPLAAGPFTIEAVPLRTNRTTQHWTVLQRQLPPCDAQGRASPEVVVTTATVVTAARRNTWGQDDLLRPDVPGPQAFERAVVPALEGMQWLGHYDLRPIHGSVPAHWDGTGEHSLSQLWMRDEPARPLDFCSLAAMADMFFPRVWLRRATMVPAGTVSMTVYFHASSADLAQVGAGYLLGQARAQAFRNGFFDQSAQLWSEAGQMLATTHQIVYFKA